MFILDIKENCRKHQIGKTVIVYFTLSVLAVVIDRIYAIFGHGVSSDAMTWMFLYPLLGGSVFYLIIGFVMPKINHFTGYRVFNNTYNSGIALLTAGSLLKGIMEIAGTSSRYIAFYYILGWLFTGTGLIILAILTANYKKISTF